MMMMILSMRSNNTTTTTTTKSYKIQNIIIIFVTKKKMVTSSSSSYHVSYLYNKITLIMSLTWKKIKSDMYNNYNCTNLHHHQKRISFLILSFVFDLSTLICSMVTIFFFCHKRTQHKTKSERTKNNLYIDIIDDWVSEWVQIECARKQKKTMICQQSNHRRRYHRDDQFLFFI